MTAEDIVPEITHPLGKHWDQPKRSDILLNKDEDVFVMTEEIFNKLATYNTSIPSGAYEGKMWKSTRFGKNYLMWYGEDKDPNKVSINNKLISIV